MLEIINLLSWTELPHQRLLDRLVRDLHRIVFSVLFCDGLRFCSVVKSASAHTTRSGRNVPVSSVLENLLKSIAEHLRVCLVHGVVYAVANVVHDSARVGFVLADAGHNHGNAGAETLLDSSVAAVGDED
jgi:hypothetical protein